MALSPLQVAKAQTDQILLLLEKVDQLRNTGNTLLRETNVIANLPRFENFLREIQTQYQETTRFSVCSSIDWNAFTPNTAIEKAVKSLTSTTVDETSKIKKEIGTPIFERTVAVGIELLKQRHSDLEGHLNTDNLERTPDEIAGVKREFEVTHILAKSLGSFAIECGIALPAAVKAEADKIQSTYQHWISVVSETQDSVLLRKIDEKIASKHPLTVKESQDINQIICRWPIEKQNELDQCVCDLSANNNRSWEWGKKNRFNDLDVLIRAISLVKARSLQGRIQQVYHSDDADQFYRDVHALAGNPPTHDPVNWTKANLAYMPHLAVLALRNKGSTMPFERDCGTTKTPLEQLDALKAHLGDLAIFGTHTEVELMDLVRTDLDTALQTELFQKIWQLSSHKEKNKILNWGEINCAKSLPQLFQAIYAIKASLTPREDLPTDSTLKQQTF